MVAAEVAVRTAVRADRGALLDVLTAAFEHDPVVGWLLEPALGGPAADPAAARRRRLFFRGLTRLALARGWCDLATEPDGATVGATVWYPPGGLPSGLGQLAQLPDLARACGRRLRVVGAADTAMRGHHPAAPHWYLQFAGVRPDRTGRGIGSALLAHRLTRVDAAGLPAYLESSSPRNDPLYQRHGFERIDMLRFGPGAPVESLMVRPARPPSARSAG